MHDKLKQLLKEALPRMVGADVMVSDDALEGGDERFMAELRRKLAHMLAEFIVDNKVLDGADASCFRMNPDDKLAATRCTVSLHMLSPKELEALMQKTFETGVQVGRAAESYKGLPGHPWPIPDWVQAEKPWEKPRKGYESKPLPKDIQDALKAMIESDFGAKSKMKGKT